MKRLFALIIVIAASLILSGCYTKGSSAPAPTNVSVVAGDSSATVSWDMAPGVEYWVFKAASSDITPLSCYGRPQCQMIMKAVSPTVVSGLANGTTYSFTVNGRINGGPGGPGSPSIQAVPRLAGATWSTGAANSAGSNDLLGITFGTVFVATGTNSAIFSSTDGQSWTPQTAINWLGGTAPAPLPALNAASYYSGNYLAVGAGGVILLSADTAATWTPQASTTINDLYAIATDGAGGYVATGASGTILYSKDAKAWGAAANNSGTTAALRGVTYGNGMFVVVGDAGTLLNSTDGNNWSIPVSISSPISTINLKAVAYGAGIFVALGDNGTRVTSTDAMTWKVQSPITSASLINAVTYGRQFIAVDNSGNIFTSTDGLTWTLAQSTTSPLYSVTHGIYDYSAVGTGGLNMYSK